MFPLGSVTYLVVNGGSQALINAHLGTLTGQRFAPYRGQSYGVDLVRINRVGLRVPGFLPADPAAYFIYGDPVLAPCRGRVVLTEDGAADMPPPQADRAHMAGNHVILECESVWIVLGHLQRGSVAVQAGQVMEAGHVLGLVGNSGNTGEPHLHVHAQRPGSTIAPLSGEPVPIRLGGRYLVRNDRVHTDR
jgi:murein DD-endopeptidase MepM/ murein hydrolase activator NlpD